jgi:ribulose-5-phosphate 4-epimerase/fuculose-1-phosphate aldolase
MQDVSSKHSVSAAEWTCRVELAAAYRLLDHFGVQDLTYNHLSARVTDEPQAILIKPTDSMFGEVTASSLVKFDLDGRCLSGNSEPLRGGGLVIHACLARLRPSANAIFHTHTPANMAVAAQRRGLLPITQQALLFHNRVAYHEFSGFEFEPGMEQLLDRDLAKHKVAILRNHGLLIAAESIAEAFVLHHFFEIAAKAQIAALSGDSDLVIPDDQVCQKAADTMEFIEATKNGGKNWASCLRLANRLFPDFAD